MKHAECSFEKEVVKAVKSDHWTGDLHNHAASCPTCGETTRVAGLMNSHLAKLLPHSFPNYRLLWLKAQYVRKQERLSVFDLVTLIGMWLVGAAVLAGLLIWRVPQILTNVADVVGRPTIDTGNIFSRGGPFAVLVGIFVMIWLLTKDSFFADR